MSESVWRIRLEMGDVPGHPIYTTDEAAARKAEAAGYTITRFVSAQAVDLLREAQKWMVWREDTPVSWRMRWVFDVARLEEET